MANILWNATMEPDSRFQFRQIVRIHIFAEIARMEIEVSYKLLKSSFDFKV